MTYELCTFPPALFESKGLLNEPQKATLADALWSTVQNQDVSIPTQAKYILDSGALLHSIPWKTVLSFIVFHGRLDQNFFAYCRHTLAMYSGSMGKLWWYLMDIKCLQ